MFGKNNYKSFIELNFEKNPEYKDIFSGSLDANSIIVNMSALGLGPFIEKETLIFFDEIQSSP
jgi:predicted AAA+ superfamily ATPase